MKYTLPTLMMLTLGACTNNEIRDRLQYREEYINGERTVVIYDPENKRMRDSNLRSASNGMSEWERAEKIARSYLEKLESSK